MKKIIMLFLAFLPVFGFADNAYKVNMQALLDGMQTMLKDADSAKFKNVQSIVTDKGVIVICGLVNAKNSYGAYEGYTPFSALDNNGKYFVIAIDDAIASACSKDGIDVYKDM